MPEMTLIVNSAIQDGETIVVSGEADGMQFERRLYLSEIDTPQKLAQWVLLQDLEPPQIVTDLQRQFTVEYHIEKVEIPETGEFVDVPVVDSATPALTT